MKKNTNKVVSNKFSDSRWKEVVNFTKIKKSGIDIDKLLSAINIKKD